ncbi:PREDICTED: uncharacterized protein LOC104700152 [Camelina sativa]|uniref:Uncharacterized protein LOC104700152 n=1 Tax=Camelina sativa TaxID=90675 RepID=A0ABM0SNR4_CAMSA|nr:PREDICTED: uncharacterized protein LOC104700152 [Camelina sativa]
MTTMMADPVKRICDELGVCNEEVICYLDGFQWNLDSAMEACRSQTLPVPLLTVQSLPVNEKSTSKASSTPPIRIDSLRSLNLQDEQSRNQLIRRFCEAAAGAEVEDAYAYLSRSNWNIDLAIVYFYDERRPTPPQGKRRRYISTPQFKQLRIGSSSSDSMEIDSTGGHIPEAKEKGSGWPPVETWIDRACNETKVSREEALFYLEGFMWNLGPAVEACRTKTLPEVLVSEESAEAPSNFPEQPSQLNDKLISSFCDAVGGATREKAISILQLCNWNIDQAVGCYFDGFSEDDISTAIDMRMIVTRGLPSLMDVDPTEPERLLKEAGVENAVVAILGLASSQVDGKAVEEDSSTETFPDPVAVQDRIVLGPRAARTTITITIILADGRSVNIPFRSNQTVRDIRDAIDELTPSNDKDYFLQSMAGVDYMDSNITVHEISAGRSTTLLQIYLNP